MANKLEIWIVPVADLNINANRTGQDGYLLLTLITDEPEPVQPYVELINQTLYESHKVQNWVINARYQEQHKAENSIVEFLANVVTFLQQNDWVISTLSIFATPLVDRAIGKFYEDPRGGVDTEEALKLAREFLEQGYKWSPGSYKHIGNLVREEPSQETRRFLKSKKRKMCHVVLMLNTGENRYYEVLVSGQGKSITCQPASKETLSLFSISEK